MHPAQRGTVAQQTRLKPSNSVVTEKWGSSLLRLFDFLLHWTNCIVRYWKWLYVVQAKKKLPEERLRPTKGRKHRWQYRQQSVYYHGVKITCIFRHLWYPHICPSGCIILYWKSLYVVHAKKQQLPEEKLRPTTGRKHKLQYRQQSARNHGVNFTDIFGHLWFPHVCPSGCIVQY